MTHVEAPVDRRERPAHGPARRLLSYIRPYRARFAAGLLCAVVTTAVSLLAPMLLQRILDDLATGLVSRQLLIFAAGLGLVLGVVGVLRFITRYVLMTASRDIEYDIRKELFAHMLTLPVSYFRQHRTGDIVSRAINDLVAVRLLTGPAVMVSTTTALTSVGVVAMMLTISVRLTLVALLPLTLIVAVVRLSSHHIQRGFHEIQAQLAVLSSAVQQMLRTVRAIRAYALESADQDRFRGLSAEYVARSRRVIGLQALVAPCTSLVFGVSALLVLWVGTRGVIAGHLSIGQFVAFFSYLLMFMWPMIACSWVTSVVQRGWPCWLRVLALLDARPAELTAAQSPRSLERPAIEGHIEFRQLTFGYDGATSLRDVSFQIAAGQTVAIVGPTGAGKSTLINLLPRLDEPPEGCVFVDGVDVRQLPVGTLRGAIGFVPQEPVLFAGTLEENVLFGVDPSLAGVGTTSAEAGGHVRADREARFASAATAARLHEDMDALGQGRERPVGERGVALSGGQRQRTAIARALATRAPILVLDDPFSASDAATAQHLLSHLRATAQSRTCIVVSHRLAAVRDADLIVVVNNGEIAERGTHEALMRHGGLYAALFRQQSLAEQLAAS